MPELVQEIGTAAGLLAVVGLAVLAALHASQARDVKRLRTWAGRAPERRATPSRRSHAGYSRIGTCHVAVAIVGLLVLGAAYGVTDLAGDDRADTSDKPKRSDTAVNPGNVTVAVLNGTTVPGLAAALRDQLAVVGFRKGAINDFSDKHLGQSVVQHAPGRQAEAKAVSRRLGISQREPVTADSRALAGEATVIVIAGADKAP